MHRIYRSGFELAASSAGQERANRMAIWSQRVAQHSAASLRHVLVPVLSLPVGIVGQSAYLTNCPNFWNRFCVLKFDSSIAACVDKAPSKFAISMSFGTAFCGTWSGNL
jgi:hypothetical protein